jgi:formamidopyrimidine-DNA glycosylase
MPELPDIVVYIERLTALIGGGQLARVRLASPFLLRTVTPGLVEAEGRRVVEVRRLGKRIVVGLEGQLFLVLHLMIAGRLHWRGVGVTVPRRVGLAAFDFPIGTLLLTEAGTKRRASLHVVQGERSLAAFGRGGLEVLDADLASFRLVLRRENHTLKRALTDPACFSGIGNAYSDEILHRARLSPFALTRKLTEPEVDALYRAARDTLSEWLERLRREVGNRFPEKVTAFREGMEVHGRFGKPCPVCGSPVQRIVYAENEANYCAPCQAGGKLLADRSLSRLLKADWPRTLEELEERRSAHRRGIRGS